MAVLLFLSLVPAGVHKLLIYGCMRRHLLSLLLDAPCTSRSANVSKSSSAAEALWWPNP